MTRAGGGLDALHLATAEHVASVAHTALTAFVAYDERLLGAARGIGLPVTAPGLSGAGALDIDPRGAI